MHLLIPHASALAEAGTHTLRELALPNLARFLAASRPAATVGSDEYSLTPPHERALAEAWGWHGDDGTLPFAARLAAADGIPTGERAWGLLTPAHWHVGTEQVSLADPAALNLSEAESRTLLDALAPLFTSEGFDIAWGAPTRWYAAHDSLAGLPCASLDRVIGRNVYFWLPTDTRARLLRRLQNEVQMLLHTHALNEAREARGELPVNSFWLSGCGRAQPVEGAAPQVDDRLRTPLLAGDWVAWAEAWQALDAGPLSQLAAAAQRGDAVSLTLAGERHAQRHDAVRRSAWQKLTGAWQRIEPHTVLESL